MKGAAMSPAQTEKQLVKQYHLALSKLRATQHELIFTDFQVSDVSQARMKLVIQKVNQQIGLNSVFSNF
jgi:hypothetical protein